jgi:hypothetical protein
MKKARRLQARMVFPLAISLVSVQADSASNKEAGTPQKK